MSSINQVRIKQICKRQNGSFSTKIPIGTEGVLVDMFSGLDLEQQNKIGGNHYTEVKKTQARTIIKEWYFSQPKGSIPIEEVQDDIVTYTVISSIDYSNQMYIIDNNNNENPLVISHNEQQEDFLVSRTKIDNDKSTVIKTKLYKGNFKIKIHQKTVHIYKNSNGDMIIDRQIDEEASFNPFE